ncbi:hypothetical protein C8J56DRAFT_1050394 [Mycena floridula]|nr:hypothetical protein C8J56DRAFT_1050394 [Mycena floridula]
MPSSQIFFHGPSVYPRDDIFILKNANLAQIQRPSPRFRGIHFTRQKDEPPLISGRALEELMEEREAASKDIVEYDRVLAPARGIPDDVLQEIFLHCVGGPGLEFPENEALLPALNRFFVNKEANVNRTLIRVCRSWRALGLACRGMWTHIGLQIGRTLPSPNHIFLLLHHLQRSGSAPLCVVLEIAPKFAANNPLLPIILASSSRWSSLLVYDQSGSFGATLAPIRGSLQALESLTIASTPNSEGPVGIEVFEFAPKLRFLRTAIGDLNAIRLPWKQITRYTNHFEHPPIDPSPLLSIPGLLLEDCTLSISDHFTIPFTSALNKLTVRNHPFPSRQASRPSCITNLIVRSQSPLTTLTLSPNLLDLLEAIPTLENLELAGDKCFTDIVASRLSYHPSGTPAALGRSLLKLTLGGKLPCKPRSFTKMLESRTLYGSYLFHETNVGVGSRLWSVRIEDPKGLAFSARDVQLLKKLCITHGMWFRNGNIEYHPPLDDETT